MMQKRKQAPLLLFFLFSSFILYAQKDSPPAASGKPGNDTLDVSKLAVKKPVYHLLYQTRSRQLTTGAVGEVYTNDLRKTASASFGGLITGRLAGLYAGQFSGEPGNDDVSLLVRGQAPLVMVDGTP